MPRPIWRARIRKPEDELDWYEDMLRLQRGMTANPIEAWREFGEGVSGILHGLPSGEISPQLQWRKNEQGEIVPSYESREEWYKGLPELSVNLPWTSPFSGEQAVLGTKGAAEWIPDIVALSGVPAGIGLRTWRGVATAPRLEKAFVRAGVSPFAGMEKATELTARAVIQPTTRALTKIFPQLPERTATHTYEQLKSIHEIAKAKKLTEKQYRRVLKLYTGKDSAKFLTRDEADTAIAALEGLRVSLKGKPIIPRKTALVPENIAKEIPALRDMGFPDFFRQKVQILNIKFGTWGREMTQQLLETELKHSVELTAFREQSSSMVKLIGNNTQSKVRIFNALENPLETHLLDANEQTVFKYFREFFDDWANRLRIPANKRRQNYITHIFEEQLQNDFKKAQTPAMELMAALDYNAPKSTFMPYLQQRLGANIGLKQDPFAAANVYEFYALKKLHYEPLVQKISAFARMLRDEKPFHYKYLDNMAKAIVGRPSASDVMINKAFGSVADGLSRIPIVNKVIPQRMTALANRGNLARLVAHNWNSLYYMSWLGFRPVSAIRNLSQQLLAVAETSTGDFTRGLAFRGTAQGRNALNKSVVYRGRLMGKPVAGLEEENLRILPRRLQDWSLGLFKWADKQNVADSFLAGYAKGKRLKLPEEWCIKLGDEVAMNTQYLYTKMARSLFEESVFGRFVTPFTSWPRNFMELQAKWWTGRPSFVLQEFERQTGKKVIADGNWGQRHKELMSYFAILTGAYVTEGLTDIRAAEYTGWTSVSNLARMLGGDIPGVTIPKGLGYIVGGSLTGDTQMVNEGWKEVRPDRFVLIIKQLEDLAEGKQDALSLFFYLEWARATERKRARDRTRQRSRTRPRTRSRSR